MYLMGGMLSSSYIQYLFFIVKSFNELLHFRLISRTESAMLLPYSSVLHHTLKHVHLSYKVIYLHGKSSSIYMSGP